MATFRSNKLLANLMDMVVELGPGAKLPAQDQLSKKFKASRTLIREQLAILEYLQIINVRPKTGTTINHCVKWTPHRDDVRDWAVESMQKHGSTYSKPGAV